MVLGLVRVNKADLYAVVSDPSERRINHVSDIIQLRSEVRVDSLASLNETRTVTCHYLHREQSGI